jgi:hypothetical protein
MLDFQTTWDTLQEWRGFLANHVPVERWPNPILWSGVAVFAGTVLMFWGARLLRPLYVLVFMLVGGAVGVRLAGVQQVDKLIGLVLGAGLAGLLAFVLFRWWVGLTTGLIAVFVLVVLGAPRLNTEFTGFNDFRQGVGSGDWNLSLRPHEEPKFESIEQLRQFAADFGRYLMEERRASVIKTSLGLGLVWLLGTAAGLMLPRLIPVLGTSLVGTVLLALGASMLLSTRWPSVWGAIVTNRAWFMSGLAVLFLAGLSYQARHRRSPVAMPTGVPATA